jgi:valyl-tRNA synthetase
LAETNFLIIFAHEFINTIKEDFCDKYLEIQKHQDTEHGEKITLRCLGSLLKMLYPFTPFVTQKIRETLGLE